MNLKKLVKNFIFILIIFNLFKNSITIQIIKVFKIVINSQNRTIEKFEKNSY